VKKPTAALRRALGGDRGREPAPGLERAPRRPGDGHGLGMWLSRQPPSSDRPGLKGTGDWLTSTGAGAAGVGADAGGAGRCGVTAAAEGRGGRWWVGVGVGVGRCGRDGPRRPRSGLKLVGPGPGPDGAAETGTAGAGRRWTGPGPGPGRSGRGERRRGEAGAGAAGAGARRGGATAAGAGATAAWVGASAARTGPGAVGQGRVQKARPQWNGRWWSETDCAAGLGAGGRRVWTAQPGPRVRRPRSGRPRSTPIGRGPREPRWLGRGGALDVEICRCQW
jgi:hypothetical protein